MCTKRLAAVSVLAFAAALNAQETDWQKIDAVLGRSAAVSGDVHRYGFPRTDLQVSLDGVALKPSFALGGWAAFKPVGKEAMVMGDLVLLGTEINPVMSKLLEGGLEITGIHNHLLRAEPATYYMHIGGHGDPLTIAGALRAALGESKTPLTAAAAGSSPTAESALKRPPTPSGTSSVR